MIIAKAENENFRTVSWAMTRLSLDREVWGSYLRPVKSDTALPTASHRRDISSNRAVLRGRNNAEVGPAISSHTSAQHSEHNLRFDSKQQKLAPYNIGAFYLPSCFGEQTAKGPLRSSSHAATCLPHMVEASHCLF